MARVKSPRRQKHKKVLKQAKVPLHTGSLMKDMTREEFLPI